MEKMLKSGVTLVIDRYSYSGIVYSSIKKNMKIQWCQEPEKGLLKPDKVFLLTLPESKIEKRPNYGSERYENKTTQKKVARAYLEMSKEQEEWEIVSGEGDIEE
ncbi:thymidylate kinase, partial [Asbolus verrucosus]